MLNFSLLETLNQARCAQLRGKCSEMGTFRPKPGPGTRLFATAGPICRGHRAPSERILAISGTIWHLLGLGSAAGTADGRTLNLNWTLHPVAQRRKKRRSGPSQRLIGMGKVL